MAMNITNQADYAIRAMLYLARLGPGKQVPSSVIAEEMSISRLFLSRINSQLSNAGLIITRRGARGGVSLAREPKDISIYAVLSAIDGPICLIDCNKSAEFCSHLNCPFRSFWQETQEMLYQRLSNTSFQDILDNEKQVFCS